jgi:broad specificity phosphatase PhoE
MPELLLVRHAEPEVKGKLLGRLDCGLSEQGREAAGKVMPAIRAAAAYTSPLRRAQETASMLDPAISRTVLGELAEIGLGHWEGKTWAEAEAQWPRLARRKTEDWFGVPAPGGESWDQVLERASAALAPIRRGPFPAVVVAHLGINAALVYLITGQNPRRHQQQYCEVLVYDLPTD